VFYHKLGTSASADDQLVYEAGAENAKWLLSCQSTDDYETLLVSVCLLMKYSLLWFYQCLRYHEAHGSLISADVVTLCKLMNEMLVAVC
jgi:hypothetical protein